MSTVFTQCDSGMRCTDLDVFSGVGHGLADLVVDSACGEIGECTGERNPATDCHSGCNADHIGFRDANLEKAVREFLFKRIHFQ